MRRWACIPMMTLCLLLTACGGTGGEAGDAADARMPYRNMAGCVMEAEVSCTQDGAAWEATLQCDYVPEGETTVEVLAPETIAGVKAVLSDGEVELVYEDQCLNAGNLSSQEVSPMACLPQLMSALRDGWLLEESEEDWQETSCFRLTVDQTGEQNGKILSTLWLRQEDGTPLRGEIAVDGEIILTADFTSFSFYDTIEEPILRRTWAEIDLDALAHNYQQARRKIGPNVKYLGVVKADAYGHGAIQVSRKLEQLGADYLAVSSLDEAKELRRAGIQAPILILGHTPPAMVPQLIEYGITQAVSALAKAEAYSAAAVESGGTLKVHIKVDTGMSRLGFLVREGHFDTGVESIAAACALPGLEAEGIFTHFAVSDEDDRDSEAYTRAQFDVFTRVLDALAAGGRTFAIRHCANSGALARYPEMYLDMVRPGIALYGVGADAQRLDLRPVMSLKSSVSTIKTFDPGTDVSYGRTFRTQGRTRIGVLPIGYADGFFRGLSNRMSVVTAQGPAPQRGRICMDMSMIDLTDLPDVKVGDEVEIFGRRQRVDDLAAILNTIPYELTCAVSKRVPRVYIEGGKIVERSLRLL